MMWQWVPLCWCASWLGMSIVHANALITPWWCHPPSGSGTWVESSGIRVGSAHLGEEDAWGVSVNVGKCLVDACGLVRPCSTSEFCVVFTVVLVSSSSTWWYSQNTILTTFIFKQKSKTTLNQMLWYQLLRNPTGDVLIVVYWRLSTLTQYLTRFGKPPASWKRSILLEIEKGYNTNTWRKRITSTQTQLPAHIAALAALLSFSLILFTYSVILSNFVLLSWCLFIGKNGAISSSSSSIMVAAHGLHHFYQWLV